MCRVFNFTYLLLCDEREYYFYIANYFGGLLLEYKWIWSVVFGISIHFYIVT